jgi:8-oxo-dGTP pyrophosphatase MutT (NUDIX family)
MRNDCVLWEKVAAGVFDSQARRRESWEEVGEASDYLAAGSSGRLGWFGGSSPGDDRDICRPTFGKAVKPNIHRDLFARGTGERDRLP